MSPTPQAGPEKLADVQVYIYHKFDGTLEQVAERYGTTAPELARRAAPSASAGERAKAPNTAQLRRFKKTLREGALLYLPMTVQERPFLWERRAGSTLQELCDAVNDEPHRQKKVTPREVWAYTANALVRGLIYSKMKVHRERALNIDQDPGGLSIVGFNIWVPDTPSLRHRSISVAPTDGVSRTTSDIDDRWARDLYVMHLKPIHEKTMELEEVLEQREGLRREAIDELKPLTTMKWILDEAQVDRPPDLLDTTSAAVLNPFGSPPERDFKKQADKLRGPLDALIRSAHEVASTACPDLLPDVAGDELRVAFHPEREYRPEEIRERRRDLSVSLLSDLRAKTFSSLAGRCLTEEDRPLFDDASLSLIRRLSFRTLKSMLIRVVNRAMLVLAISIIDDDPASAPFRAEIDAAFDAIGRATPGDLFGDTALQQIVSVAGASAEAVAKYLGTAPRSGDLAALPGPLEDPFGTPLPQAVPVLTEPFYLALSVVATRAASAALDNRRGRLSLAESRALAARMGPAIATIVGFDSAQASALTGSLSAAEYHGDLGLKKMSEMVDEAISARAWFARAEAGVTFISNGLKLERVLDEPTLKALCKYDTASAGERGEHGGGRAMAGATFYLKIVSFFVILTEDDKNVVRKTAKLVGAVGEKWAAIVEATDLKLPRLSKAFGGLVAVAAFISGVASLVEGLERHDTAMIVTGSLGIASGVISGAVVLFAEAAPVLGPIGVVVDALAFVWTLIQVLQKKNPRDVFDHCLKVMEGKEEGAYWFPRLCEFDHRLKGDVEDLRRKLDQCGPFAPLAFSHENINVLFRAGFDEISVAELMGVGSNHQPLLDYIGEKTNHFTHPANWSDSQ